MDKLVPAQTERFEIIDCLRGCGLFGILLMNITSFGHIFIFYVNPMAYGTMERQDLFSWIFTHSFAQLKFITIYSMVFGAGLILFSEKIKLNGGSIKQFNLKRNISLIFIGLIHGYFFWHGDVLAVYGFCGLLLLYCLEWSSKKLIIYGFIMISVSSLIALFKGHFSFTMVSADSIYNLWFPTKEAISYEISIFRKGWFEGLLMRMSFTNIMYTTIFPQNLFWRIIGSMLIGMGLYKLGFLTGNKSIKTYKKSMLLGFFFGFPIIFLGIYMYLNSEFEANYSYYYGEFWNYWGSLGVSFGYVCAIILIEKKKLLVPFMKTFKLVGRLGLSNYLFQTIVCIFIFRGIGLGLFGQLNRLSLIGLTILIFLVQVLISNIYLKYFTYGPFEWIIRKFIYENNIKLICTNLHQ